MRDVVRPDKDDSGFCRLTEMSSSSAAMSLSRFRSMLASSVETRLITGVFLIRFACEANRRLDKLDSKFEAEMLQMNVVNEFPPIES